MKRHPLFFVLLICSCLTIFSCGEVDITNLDPAQFPVEPTNPVGNNNVSYSGDLVPAFQSAGCTLCHGSSLAQNNLRVDVYSSITGNIDGQATSRVDLANPSNSYILTYPNSASHTGSSLPSGLAQDILSWITDGALNN
ncbi:MAG TPA: hypothetical protein PKC21_01525 [Oligoflexia bacterium]|nr:hypothetical protein [Oligoflexia bacterium]HMR24011.1 hypothetical protein [Oligoflexia bacterium]